jgi:hypothetical protein
MALNADWLDGIALANVKTMSELAVQNAINNQQLNYMIDRKATAKSLESMDVLNVSEGLGIAAAQRGDLAKVQAELGSITAALQQIMKGAQTTPPVTP